MRFAWTWALLAALALAAPAVAEGAPADGATETPEAAPPMPVDSTDAIVGTAWRATRIGDTDTQHGIDSTLEVRADGRVSGSGGCNRFHGGVKPDGEQKFGLLAATRMTCPEPYMEQERRFFEALGKVRRVESMEATLLLLDEDEAVLAVLEQVPFPEHDPS